MSAVIEFPVSRVRKSASGGNATSAEVVIFPGVRFERLERIATERPAVRSKRNTAQARLLDIEEA